MIIAGQILCTELNQRIHYFLIGLSPGKKEIRLLSATQINGFAFVDPMGVHDDPASLRLPEYPGQPYNRDPV